MTYNRGMASVAKNRKARLDIRLTDEERALIERAAELKASTLTQWTARHLLEAARRDIEEETSLRLASKDFDRFLEVLDEPTSGAANVADASSRVDELLNRDPEWA
ncbi:hypothetical protein KIM372_00670 [Bombiscardovia nodaiensis]|uniref:DUF1778 domain-containing protein n=1 Tax=Bombiscardovia nodaiensis TaxID=2932181 RepID=A0ABN6SBG0_9BIFI|nr:hypothetical protein KIM372_00670 [Bombiscardovia nodaiensis]